MMVPGRPLCKCHSCISHLSKVNHISRAEILSSYANSFWKSFKRRVFTFTTLLPSYPSRLTSAVSLPASVSATRTRRQRLRFRRPGCSLPLVHGRLKFFHLCSIGRLLKFLSRPLGDIPWLCATPVLSRMSRAMLYTAVSRRSHQSCMLDQMA